VHRSFGVLSSAKPVVVISKARKVARIIVIATASIEENAEKVRRSKLA
jgi:hypothetical protein